MTGGVDETISEVCGELLGKRIFDDGIDGFRADGAFLADDNADYEGEEESDEFHNKLDDYDSNGERYIRYNADAQHFDYDSAN